MVMFQALEGDEASCFTLPTLGESSNTDKSDKKENEDATEDDDEGSLDEEDFHQGPASNCLFDDNASCSEATWNKVLGIEADDFPNNVADNSTVTQQKGLFRSLRKLDYFNSERAPAQQDATRLGASLGRLDYVCPHYNCVQLTTDKKLLSTYNEESEKESDDLENLENNDTKAMPKTLAQESPQNGEIYLAQDDAKDNSTDNEIADRGQEQQFYTSSNMNDECANDSIPQSEGLTRNEAPLDNRGNGMEKEMPQRRVTRRRSGPLGRNAPARHGPLRGHSVSSIPTEHGRPRVMRTRSNDLPLKMTELRASKSAGCGTGGYLDHLLHKNNRPEGPADFLARGVSRHRSMPNGGRRRPQPPSSHTHPNVPSSRPMRKSNSADDMISDSESVCSNSSQKSNATFSVSRGMHRQSSMPALIRKRSVKNNNGNGNGKAPPSQRQDIHCPQKEDHRSSDNDLDSLKRATTSKYPEHRCPETKPPPTLMRAKSGTARRPIAARGVQRQNSMPVLQHRKNAGKMIFDQHHATTSDSRKAPSRSKSNDFEFSRVKRDGGSPGTSEKSEQQPIVGARNQARGSTRLLSSPEDPGQPKPQYPHVPNAMRRRRPGAGPLPRRGVLRQNSMPVLQMRRAGNLPPPMRSRAGSSEDSSTSLHSSLHEDRKPRHQRPGSSRNENLNSRPINDEEPPCRIPSGRRSMIEVRRSNSRRSSSSERGPGGFGKPGGEEPHVLCRRSSYKRSFSSERTGAFGEEAPRRPNCRKSIASDRRSELMGLLREEGLLSDDEEPQSEKQDRSRPHSISSLEPALRQRNQAGCSTSYKPVDYPEEHWTSMPSVPTLL